MATKSQESQLTSDQRPRIEAAKAKRRTPEARAEEAKIREAVDREYRETGTIEAAGDAIATEGRNGCMRSALRSESTFVMVAPPFNPHRSWACALDRTASTPALPRLHRTTHCTDGKTWLRSSRGARRISCRGTTPAPLLN